ncbi:MBOAT, membrane-bound O-acyltransferase family-domain-containing protein [Schizophyllum commune]
MPQHNANDDELEYIDLSLPSPNQLQHPTSSTHSHPRMRLVDLTVDIPSSERRVPQEKLAPPRWRTKEFLVYYVVAACVLPLMAYIPMRLSHPWHRNYVLYEHRLTNGWIAGRKIDNSDAQYRSFRDNVPHLTAATLLFAVLKLAWTRLAPRRGEGDMSHIPFRLVLSLIMVFVLHGTSTFKILLILSSNYYLAKTCRGSGLGPVLTWIFNLAVLFLNDYYNGYRYGEILPSLHILDSYDGLYPRWHISYNITMLRIISYNMDLHWASTGAETPQVDRSSPLDDRQRTRVSHPREVYGFVNYLTYILYAPLYIAGPIMTFNDFMWQHRTPIPPSRRALLSYIFRWVACMLTMEVILHYMYVVAIKDARAWPGDTPAEIAMIGFWNLAIVWLKLLLPWRFFRLWALVDGIDPPENMVRCMANNYSTFGFWRSWHRSYNLWIVRYIYIPLGGSKRVLLNSLLVFSFVALWHDLTFRLLAWGWLVTLFVVPEIIGRKLLPESRFGDRPWYRHVCAFGGVLNVLMMMTANLVGFVIGIDGVKYFLHQLVGSTEGLRFLAAVFACLFVGVQLMFEYREEELRQGIVRKC